jgi:hypothetical protein
LCSSNRFSCDAISYVFVPWIFIFSSSMNIACFFICMWNHILNSVTIYKTCNHRQNAGVQNWLKFSSNILSHISIRYFHQITRQCEETFSFEWPKTKKKALNLPVYRRMANIINCNFKTQSLRKISRILFRNLCKLQCRRIIY